MTAIAHQPDSPYDPLADGERLADAGVKKNYAKVGGARPSSLLYTYGPGSIMDLPHFTVMPLGLDSWDAIWRRRDGIPTVNAPRLLEVVRMMLGHQVVELRPFPHQPNLTTFSREGSDLGVPARVFPQWMRCTGCDRLGPISIFSYSNTNPFRPDEAQFVHQDCRGRKGRNRGKKKQPVVTARYLLACADGHLDEFPYDWWVHNGSQCPAAPDAPVLTMDDRTGGRGASAIIGCASCDARRAMNEAQGQAGRAKLPRCRGRLPHFDGFAAEGCVREARLMLVGASNLWFPALQSIIDMPRFDPAEQLRDRADQVKAALGEDLREFAEQLKVLRALLKGKVDVTELSDPEFAEVVATALAPPESEEAREKRRADWEPVDLLVPEWLYLLNDPARERHQDSRSGLTLSPRTVDATMPDGVRRVLAVDRLRKVNAVVGFTRIDELDRINDLTSRLVDLTALKPTWALATEDRGEGIFLQLDEDKVAQWEARVSNSVLWQAHEASHLRNFERRFSETAEVKNPESRLKPPRYWMLHTLAHILIRQMAMHSGYGAASLSERIYAWPDGGDGRPPAAGILLCTTASDSDGTLGGLVRLSQPGLLAGIVRESLHQASRCSSDPVCSRRTPADPEDFLHGAACHCCVMASETSCERANRFLDRRFLLNVGGESLGFFGDSHAW